MGTKPGLHSDFPKVAELSRHFKTRTAVYAQLFKNRGPLPTDLQQIHYPATLGFSASLLILYSRRHVYAKWTPRRRFWSFAGPHDAAAGAGVPAIESLGQAFSISNVGTGSLPAVSKDLQEKAFSWHLNIQKKKLKVGDVQLTDLKAKLDGTSLGTADERIDEWSETF